MTADFDAVVLAGGRAERLGGAPKPLLRTGRRSLLERALDAAAGAGQVVVVGPVPSGGAPGVLATREDPPFGGPVAGIAAGVAALAAHDGAAPWVLVLAVDVPRAAEVVPLLRAAVGQRPGSPGAHLTADGRAQWLVGLYRRDVLTARLDALRAAGGVDGAPVRRLVAGPAWLEVEDPGGLADDVDTWADAARLGVTGPDPSPHPDPTEDA